MDLTKDIAWAGIELRVPGDWEITTHSVSLREGGLFLVDRMRQRMEVKWLQCARKPDLKHNCEDLRSRLKEQDSEDDLPRLKSVPGWLGFWRRLDEHSVIAYALRWHQESERVVQANVIARCEDDIDANRLVEGVLKGIRFSGTDRPMRWKAFGIECLSPVGWRLVSTQVRPMDVMMKFQEFLKKSARKEDKAEEEKEKANKELVIYRWGMASSWFNGNARSLVQNKEPKLDYVFEDTNYLNHSAVSAIAKNEGMLLLRMIGRKRFRRELIWHCEPMNSVYRVSALSPPGETVLPGDFMANCHHDRSIRE